MRWALGNVPMPQRHLRALARHAATSGWSSDFWLTPLQAELLREFLPVPVRFRANAAPLELSVTVADLVAEISRQQQNSSASHPLNTVNSENLELFPMFMLPVETRKSLHKQFRNPQQGRGKSWILRQTSSPSGDSPLFAWKEASKEELFVVSTHPLLQATQAIGELGSLTSRLYLSHPTPGQLQLPPMIDIPITLQVFNAQQTENPSILDAALVPTNPAEDNRPWEPGVGQRLAFIGVQMKYASNSWVEVPRPTAANTEASVSGTSPTPHRVAQKVEQLMYHISAFHVKDQCSIVRQMPDWLRKRSHIKASRYLGRWFQGQANFECNTRPYGDVRLMYLSESEGYTLQTIMRSSIFIAHSEIHGLRLPPDAKNFSVRVPINIERFFLNKDQLADPTPLFGSGCFEIGTSSSPQQALLAASTL